MKRLITILPAILLVLVLSGHAKATYYPNVDYSTEMTSAAVVGDYDSGLAAQAARDEKIATGGLNAKSYSFEDLMYLSKIMYAEAGSEWLSDEWKMCVGEVVLNRVASPEFPKTIKDVIQQPGQYYNANSWYFNKLIPSERCVKLAVRLLNGERNLAPSVVFQANFAQGGGTEKAFYDRHLGWTYFCYSTKTSLYQ